MTIGSTLITLPSGFTPAQNFTNIMLKIQYDVDDSFRMFACTMTAGSNNITINKRHFGTAPLDGGTWNVMCNFGYEAQPR